MTVRNIKTREGYDFWDKLCAIPRHGFIHSPDNSRVLKVEGIGNWIDMHAAQEVVDAAQDEVNGLRAERDQLRAERDGANHRAAMLLKEKNELADRARAAEEEAGQLRAAISTPETVFVNMKRGTIATPSLRSMIDLYGEVVNGEEAQLLEIARLRAEVEALLKVQSQAAADVLAERRRQVEAEGWSPEHDDEHGDGQMAVAAGYYALACGYPHERDIGRGHVPAHWPWDRSWWKPKGCRSNLIRAGALILAEIERLDRAAMAAKEGV